MSDLPSEGCLRGGICGPAAKAAAAPLFDFIESQGASGRSASHRGHRSLRIEWTARKGVCSTFFADRVGSDTKVPVFVHKSPSFKLPADGSKPIIMVGPGTGIAPFRAFLEERRAVGASGRNWLFFGDQKAACDFLYREELEAMQKDGFLTRLDTAFSRDQAEKIYVQDRMIENARRDLVLAAGRWIFLCLRRCKAHGEGRRHGAAQDRRNSRSASPRNRRWITSSNSRPKSDTCAMCIETKDRLALLTRTRVLPHVPCMPRENR